MTHIPLVRGKVTGTRYAFPKRSLWGGRRKEEGGRWEEGKKGTGRR
jgi:hypothetical protein